MANNPSQYDGFDWTKWYTNRFDSWAHDLLTPKIQETLNKIARQANTRAADHLRGHPVLANEAMQYSPVTLLDSVKFPQIATMAKEFATSDAIAELFRKSKHAEDIWSRELASSFASFAKLQTTRSSGLLSPNEQQGLIDLADVAEQTLSASSYEPIVEVARSVEAGEYESSTIEAIEEFLDSPEGRLPPIDDATLAMLALRPDLERAYVRVAIFIVFAGSWTALVLFVAFFLPGIFTGITALVKVPSSVDVGHRASRKAVDSWVPYQATADKDDSDDSPNAP